MSEAEGDLTAPIAPAPGSEELMRCPKCGSVQFYGRRKVTGLGWTLFFAGLGTLLISIPLMFVWIGFCTVFMAPPLAILGIYVCRRPVNVCARCRAEF